MSGADIIKKLSRRNFLTKIAGFTALAGLGLSIWKFGKKKNLITGNIIGASAHSGHMLRNINFDQPPSETIETDVAIVGAGISGLSAARWLTKHSSLNSILIDLENQTGGNSTAGHNDVSKFPVGAHYLPLPNSDLTELKDFLKESDIITGQTAEGKDIFNEYYLCFAPEERLFIHGHWQQGIIPQTGISEKDNLQIDRFQKLMNDFRSKKGADNKYLFTIPVDNSSADIQTRELDNTSMADYMLKNGFDSEYLHWYVNYCCRDDYGTTIQQTSAWAGIHYFAGRRANAAEHDHNTVLTWPEGNNFLANKLHSQSNCQTLTNSLVYQVSHLDNSVQIDFLDLRTRQSKRIIANHCIMATPQFVNERILASKPDSTKFTYAPWMVANITIADNKLLHKNNALAWDNVIFQSKSLGYVHANHQNISANAPKHVLTYYLPLCDTDPKTARIKALQTQHPEWVKLVTDDLDKVHIGIAKHIENIDIWLWGHGMIRPVPGYIWGNLRKEASTSLGNNIHFAHTDLSGISIFEEAFYQGVKAAKSIIVAQNA